MSFGVADYSVGSVGGNTTSAAGLVVAGSNGAATAWFESARVSDRSGGVPFDAMCCGATTEERTAAREVMVDVVAPTVLGNVLFRQRGPDFPVEMTVGLRGVGDANVREMFLLLLLLLLLSLLLLTTEQMRALHAAH
jgi:hypothetical protein